MLCYHLVLKGVQYLLYRGEEILYFSITTRSKLGLYEWCISPKYNLTRARIKIKDKIFKIIAVKSDHLVLSTYHEVEISDEATTVFVIDNYIGIGSLSSGDNLITNVANIDLNQDM